MSYNNMFIGYNNEFPINQCKVSLRNKQLWEKFHKLETEMIITKSGRRMFPSFHIDITDLDPNAEYCVFLEMTPASHCRYKYSSSGGWAPAGNEESQSHMRNYLHPESPAKGEYWMSQPVSFGRLKLTNTPAPPAGQVVLTSMHKYQPRVIIAKTHDPRTVSWSPSTSVMFVETQFIAVTAYQNEKITKLKIDNNPFAKGFRANGQSKCKRKRVAVKENEDESLDKESSKELDVESLEIIDVTGDRMSESPKSVHDLPVEGVHSRLSLSPTVSNCSSVSQEHVRFSSRHFSTYSFLPYPYMPEPSLRPFTYSSNSYNNYYSNYPTYTSMWQYPEHYFARYQPNVSLPVALPEDLSVQHADKRPRKLTDHSMKSILGFS